MQTRHEYIGAVFRHLIQGISKRIPSQCRVPRLAHATGLRGLRCGVRPANAPVLHLCPACAVAYANVAPASHRTAAAGRLLGRRADITMVHPGGRLQVPTTPGMGVHICTAHSCRPLGGAGAGRCRLADPYAPVASAVAGAALQPGIGPGPGLDASKVNNKALRPPQDSPPQRTLSRHDRLLAVRHAYAIDPLQAHHIARRRIVLLDDVMTSGASLHAAARALRGAGATHITGLVLARTE